MRNQARSVNENRGSFRTIAASTVALLLLVTNSPGYGQAEHAQSAAIKPFKAHIPDSALADLSRRLAQTKWPDQLPGTTWEYGADISKVRELADYWQKGYDWRAQEARINRFDQFTTEIDGQTIHFIHERSTRAGAIPLMLIHGWPGSIVEFLSLIEPLTNPKDSNAPAFDVVVPSLPGFGFSGPTTSRGWDAARMAKALNVLMDRLGYSRYGIQGGDWGSGIARQMARQAPTRVIGLHLNLLPVPPPSPDAINQMTAVERRHYKQWWDQGRSTFFNLQSSEPQTVAYSLTDSPVGWMAWLAERFQDLTDNDGDFLHAVDRDTFLTDVTLFWVTGTVASYRLNAGSSLFTTSCKGLSCRRAGTSPHSSSRICWCRISDCFLPSSIGGESERQGSNLQLNPLMHLMPNGAGMALADFRPGALRGKVSYAAYPRKSWYG
jgi:pimeloyl-ACP methyl ester carboxylesterase